MPAQKMPILEAESALTVDVVPTPTESREPVRESMQLDHEIVTEDDIRAWQENERAACLLKVSVRDARAVRERGLAFFEWVEAGED